MKNKRNNKINGFISVTLLAVVLVLGTLNYVFMEGIVFTLEKIDPSLKPYPYEPVVEIYEPIDYTFEYEYEYEYEDIID